LLSVKPGGQDRRFEKSEIDLNSLPTFRDIYQCKSSIRFACGADIMRSLSWVGKEYPFIRYAFPVREREDQVLLRMMDLFRKGSLQTTQKRGIPEMIFITCHLRGFSHQKGTQNDRSQKFLAYPELALDCGYIMLIWYGLR